MRTRLFAFLCLTPLLAMLGQVSSAAPDTTQTVGGVSLDVQSLSTGGSQKMTQVVPLDTQAPAEPPPAPDPAPAPDSAPAPDPAPAAEPATQARSAAAPDPVVSTEPPTTTEPQATPPPQPVVEQTTSSPEAVTPPPPPPVVPLAYEVVERRPDFIYRPGRLSFQMQNSYQMGQSNLAVGRSVSPGRVRYVPMGQF
ncbi:MAG: hypothetical protein U0931_35755 [Vulcanimicrobiota bacterium]